ncbi:MAG TPA: DsbA family protein [Granulicella sp.]|nr:DsbA family protein [Granulicella sp.]
MIKRIGLWCGLAFALPALGVLAQDKIPGADSGAAPKAVQTAPAASNPSAGITSAQADALLSELRQIRQLLEKQQAAAAQLNRPALEQLASADKVAMTVGQGWHVLGREDAPVTMVEFTDYQCPFCRRFEADSFAQLKKTYIDTGKVRFVSRDLPLEFHPNAPRAAVAVRCAGEQHKFWEMHDTIMQDTATDLGPASLLNYGRKVNLDMPAFGACLSDQKLVAAIQKDTTDAATLGISGTPSFVIGKTASDRIDGVRIVGAVPYTVFDSTIKTMLAQ